MTNRTALRTVLVALATTAALGLGAGCTLGGSGYQLPGGTMASIDPMPEGMVEVSFGYFAFAIPEEWEPCTDRECYGRDQARVWAHGAGRLVVPSSDTGWACPEPEQPSTMTLAAAASRYLPDTTDTDGERGIRVEVPVVGSRELVVPNADGAWQYEITGSDGAQHMVNQVYLTSRMLTMYFLYLDDDVVTQVTDTVIAGGLESPWTPPEGFCTDPDDDDA